MAPQAVERDSLDGMRPGRGNQLPAADAYVAAQLIGRRILRHRGWTPPSLTKMIRLTDPRACRDCTHRRTQTPAHGVYRPVSLAGSNTTMTGRNPNSSVRAAGFLIGRSA